MAGGDIRAKERAIVTLTSSLASITSGSAAACGTDLDGRSGGNAPDDLRGRLELLCQWGGSISGIVAGTIVAEAYLVPLLDGTNLPDVDLTSGSSKLPNSCYVGAFEATKGPTISTNMRFISPAFDFDPLLYRVYIQNRSGQTIAANATVKLVSFQAQYT